MLRETLHCEVRIETEEIVDHHCMLRECEFAVRYALRSKKQLSVIIG
jgi:hypothetical protein